MGNRNSFRKVCCFLNQNMPFEWGGQEMKGVFNIANWYEKTSGCGKERMKGE